MPLLRHVAGLVGALNQCCTTEWCRRGEAPVFRSNSQTGGVALHFYPISTTLPQQLPHTMTREVQQGELVHMHTPWLQSGMDTDTRSMAQCDVHTSLTAGGAVEVLDLLSWKGCPEDIASCSSHHMPSSPSSPSSPCSLASLEVLVPLMAPVHYLFLPWILYVFLLLACCCAGAFAVFLVCHMVEERMGPDHALLCKSRVD